MKCKLHENFTTIMAEVSNLVDDKISDIGDQAADKGLDVGEAISKYDFNKLIVVNVGASKAFNNMYKADSPAAKQEAKEALLAGLSEINESIVDEGGTPVDYKDIIASTVFSDAAPTTAEYENPDVALASALEGAQSGLEHIDMTVEEFRKVNKAIYDEESGKERPVTTERFLTTLLPDSEAVYSDFGDFMKEMYNKAVIDLDSDNPEYEDDADFIAATMHDNINALAEEAAVPGVTLESLLLSGSVHDADVAYAAMVAGNIDDAISLFSGGIKKYGDTFIKTGKSNIRVANEVEGTTNSLSNASPEFKAALESVPLFTVGKTAKTSQRYLSRVGGQGRFVSQKAIKNVLGSLHSKNTMKDFKETLKKRIKSGGVNEDVYVSLYAHFFASPTDTVLKGIFSGGKIRYSSRDVVMGEFKFTNSIQMVADQFEADRVAESMEGNYTRGEINSAADLINEGLKLFTSSEAPSYVSAVNGQASEKRGKGVYDQSTDGFVDDFDKSDLTVAKKRDVRVHYDERLNEDGESVPGFLTISYNGVERAFDLNGFDFNSTTTPVKTAGKSYVSPLVFQKLGMGNVMDTEFLSVYTRIAQSAGPDYSLDNMVGNILYLKALNDPKTRAILESHNLVRKAEKKFKLASGSKNQLSIYKNLPTMSKFMVGAFNQRLNVDSPNTITNESGDSVATHTAGSTFSSIARVAKDINAQIVSGEYTGVMANDPVILDNRIGRITYKDAVSVGGRSKKATQADKLDSMRLLSDVLFFGTAASSSYSSAVLQTHSVAERTKVPCVVYTSGDLVTGSTAKVRNDYKTQITSKAAFHSDNIKDGWRKFTLDLVDSGTITSKQAEGIENAYDGSLNQFNDVINDLAKVINKDNPTAARTLVEGSDFLIAGIHYKLKNKEDVSISQSLLDMDTILGIKGGLDKLIDSRLEKFKGDLLDIGYSPSAAAMGTVKARLAAKKRLKDVPDISNYMIEEFFYHNNVATSTVTDLLGLNINLFPEGVNTISDVDAETIRMFSTEKVEGDPAMQETSTDPKVLADHAFFVHEAIKADIKVREAILRLSLAESPMFKAQSKRVAIVTSGIQQPRMYQAGEKGRGIGEHTNTVLIADDVHYVKLLGTNKATKQDTRDAVQWTHTLYDLKMAHSMGGSKSAVNSKGGATKDVSVEVDLRTGYGRGQKKSSQPVWRSGQREFLTPATAKLEEHMSKIMPYNDGDGVFFNPVTLEMSTVKTPGAIKVYNLWDLFQFYGGYEGDHEDGRGSWEHVLDVLGDNPEYREHYAEKLGFPSGEKYGNRALNSFKDVLEGNMVPTKFSNVGHGQILQPDHDPDVFHGDPSKAMMTQIVTAAAAEGDTHSMTININKTLASLSRESIKKLKRDKDAHQMQILKSLAVEGRLSADDYRSVMIGLGDYYATSEIPSRLNQIIDKHKVNDLASRSYMQSITGDALRSRDSGSMSNILNELSSDAYASPTLESVAYSSLMSKVEAITSSIKFRGQEFVVAATHNSLMVYESTHGDRMSRVAAMKSDAFKFSKVINSESDLIDVAPDDMLRITTVEDDQEYHEIVPASKLLYTYDEETGGYKKLNPAEVDVLFEQATIEAKDLGEPSNLNWVQYNYKGDDGKTVYLEKTAEYLAVEAANLELVVYSELDDVDPSDEQGLKERENHFQDLEKIKATADYKLRKLLNDESKGWATVDAEFYMPITHASRYGLLGTDGEVDASVAIEDIIPSNEGDESRVVYIKNGIEVSKDDNPDTELTADQIRHMTQFFTGRVLANKGLFPSKFFPPKSSTRGGVRNRIKDLESLIASQPEGSSTANIAEGLKLKLEALDVFTEDSIGDAYDAIYKDEAVNIGLNMAMSFPKTLTLFAARVPAQAKQSGVVGKVKGFITGARNTVFGPLEMLTVTGADLDIDKAHILVYGVDKYGKIYNPDMYLTDGEIDFRKADKIRLDETARVLAIENTRRTKNLSYAVAKINADTELSAEEAATKVNVAESNFANSMASLNLELVSQVATTHHTQFIEAIKNHVLDGLVSVWRDPKNAIEISSPITMGVLDVVKDETIREESRGAKVEIVLGTNGRVLRIVGLEVMSPGTPTSITVLEKVNAGGAELIGVAAVGIKGSGAITVAAMQDPNSPSILFGAPAVGAGRMINIKKGLKLPAGENISYVGYTDKDGNVISSMSSKIANTDHIPNRNVEDADAETIEAFERLDFDLLNANTQSWNSLSQILSAATDNAKELILDKIGLSKDLTPPVIAGIIMGHDVRVLLGLLKHESVTKLVDAHNATSRITGENSFSDLSKVFATSALSESPSVKTALGSPISSLAHLFVAANELGMISSPAGINTNMANSQVDTILYYNRFNKKIPAEFKARMKELKIPSDLASYIDMLSAARYEGDNEVMAAAAVEANKKIGTLVTEFDAIKTAFNPYYVLKHNDHFVSYMEGLNFGASETAGALPKAAVLNTLVSKIDKVETINESSLRELSSFANQIIVDNYFDVSNTKTSIGSKEFDLSRPADRESFIEGFMSERHAISGLDGAADNFFLKHYITGKHRNQNTDILIPRTPFSHLNDVDKAAYRAGLRKLGSPQVGKDSKESARINNFYKNIFFYDLILNKGKVGESSLTEFFSDSHKEYKEFHLSSFRPDIIEGLKRSEKVDIVTIAAHVPSLQTAKSTKPSSRRLEDHDTENTVKIRISKRSVNDRLQRYSVAPPKSILRSIESGVTWITESVRTPALGKDGKPSLDAKGNKVYDKVPTTFVVVPKHARHTTPFSLADAMDTTGDWLQRAGFVRGIAAVDLNNKPIRVIRPTVLGVLIKDITKGEKAAIEAGTLLSDGHYQVATHGNDLIAMSTADLLKANPGMTFRGNNFGVTAQADLTNPSFRRSINGSAPGTLKDTKLEESLNLKYDPEIVHDRLVTSYTNHVYTKALGSTALVDLISRHGSSDGEMRKTTTDDDGNVVETTVLVSGGVKGKHAREFHNIQGKLDNAIRVGIDIAIHPESSTEFKEEVASYIVNQSSDYTLIDTEAYPVPTYSRTKVGVQAKGVVVLPDLRYFGSSDPINRFNSNSEGTNGIIPLVMGKSDPSKGPSSLYTYTGKLLDASLPMSDVSMIRLSSDLSGSMPVDIPDAAMMVYKKVLKAVEGRHKGISGNRTYKVKEITNALIAPKNKKDSYVLNATSHSSLALSIFARSAEAVLADINQRYNLNEGTDVLKGITPKYAGAPVSKAEVMEARKPSGDYAYVKNQDRISFDIYKGIGLLGSHKASYENTMNKLRNAGFGIIKTSGVAFSLINPDALRPNTTKLGFIHDGRSEISGDLKSKRANLDKMAKEKRPEAKHQLAPAEFIDVNGAREASRAVSPEVIALMADKMREVTGVNIEVLSPTTIKAEFGEAMANSSGFTIGNRVIINEAKVTLDTMVHELGHVYMAKLKEVNPGLHKIIMDKALAHPMADTIRKKYKEMNLSEEGVADEVFSTLLGLGNQDAVLASIESDADKGGFSIRKFFNDIFNTIFGSKKKLNIEGTTTLGDIIKEIGNDIITNKSSILAGMSSEGKSNIKAMISGTITTKEMLKRLKEKGFITKYCN